MHNGFEQEMKRVALLETMGGVNLKSNQGPSIFKTILFLLFNIHVLYGKHNKIQLESLVVNGEFSGQMEEMFYQDMNKIKNSYEWTARSVTDF